MNVLNKEKLIKSTVQWINWHLSDSNKKSVVVPISGGVNSTLVLNLCKKLKNVKIYAIHYPNFKSMNFIEKITKSNKCNLISTELDIQPYLGHNPEAKSNSDDATDDYRSGYVFNLAAAVAKEYSGLVVGSLDRNRRRIVRYYKKYGNGKSDILPIGDIFRSEVEVLAQELCPEILNEPSYLELSDSKQSHEERLGLSFDEIEWGDTENEKSDIILGSKNPANYKHWFAYTKRQKEIISRMRQLNKATKHKRLHQPVFRVRKDTDGLVS